MYITELLTKYELQKLCADLPPFCKYHNLILLVLSFMKINDNNKRYIDKW